MGIFINSNGTKKINGIFTNLNDSKKSISSIYGNLNNTVTPIFSKSEPEDESDTKLGIAIAQNENYEYSIFKLKFSAISGKPTRFIRAVNYYESIYYRNKIVYGKGVFVRIYSYRGPMWSYNGTNWTNASGIPNASRVVALFYGEGYFFVVTQVSSSSPWTVYISQDGKVWSLFYSGSTSKMNWIYQVGRSGNYTQIIYESEPDRKIQAIYSTDNTNWYDGAWSQSSNPVETAAIEAMATYNGYFVTGGVSSLSTGFTNFPSQYFNGTTWNKVGNTYLKIYDITRVGSQFYAAAEFPDGTYWIVQKYYAYNDWSKKAQIPYRINCISFGYGYYIIICDYGHCYYSSDAINWTALPDITTVTETQIAPRTVIPNTYATMAFNVEP